MNPSITKWVKLAALGFGISALVYGCNARNAQLAAEDALRRKVEANFENYVRAAPLLKGPAAQAFNDVAERKLSRISTPSERGAWKAQGLSVAQQWRSANEAISKRKAATEVAYRAGIESMEVAIAACEQGEHDMSCREVMETWMCMQWNRCTEIAYENLTQWANDVEWCGEFDGYEPVGFVNQGVQCVD